MRPDASHAICVSPPAVEPVSLAEVKAQMRVDGDDEDALITDLISVARERLEQETRRAFIKQRWTAYITGNFSSSWGPVELPRPRIISDEDNPFLLQYRDDEGAWHADVSMALYAQREPALLYSLADQAGIGTANGPQDALWRATYWTGYGETPESVPAPIRRAIMLLVAHLFDRREPVTTGIVVMEVPKSLDWLLDPYRVPWGGSIK